MLQQLESESWIQQAEALHYLGEHRVGLAADDVRALLNDKTVHSWIRGRALLTLSQIENGVDPGEFGKWVAHDQGALRAAAERPSLRRAAPVCSVAGGRAAPGKDEERRGPEREVTLPLR